MFLNNVYSRDSAGSVGASDRCEGALDHLEQLPPRVKFKSEYMGAGMVTHFCFSVPEVQRQRLKVKDVNARFLLGS